MDLGLWAASRVLGLIPNTANLLEAACGVVDLVGDKGRRLDR